MHIINCVAYWWYIFPNVLIYRIEQKEYYNKYYPFPGCCKMNVSKLVSGTLRNREELISSMLQDGHELLSGVLQEGKEQISGMLEEGQELVSSALVQEQSLPMSLFLALPVPLLILLISLYAAVILLSALGSLLIIFGVARLAMYTANEERMRIQYKCPFWNFFHSQTK
jgi:hypothetical protein